MSPRAAWRLEAAGFGPVHDYAAGKTDWLAADLPFDGTAQLAGMFTRRGVATAGESTPAAEALRLLDAQGFGPLVVLNPAGVVMGAAHRRRRVAGAPDGPRGGDSGGGDPVRWHTGRAVLRRRHELLAPGPGRRARCSDRWLGRRVSLPSGMWKDDLGP